MDGPVGVVATHGKVVQATALAADGIADEEIARLCQVDSNTVRSSRRRFAERGVEDVGVIAKGRGRKSCLATWLTT